MKIGNVFKRKDVKKKPVTASEIRDNIERIQRAMSKMNPEEDPKAYQQLADEMEEEFARLKKCKTKVTGKDIQENIGRIMNAMKLTPEGSEEYERLSKELEHEYVILRKYKDSRFYIEPKQYLLIGGGVLVTVFFVALEREVPSVNRFVSTMFKIMPFRG